MSSLFVEDGSGFTVRTVESNPAFVRVGQFWLLSSGFMPEAMILVTKVEGSYVLGMPVVLGSLHATGREIVFPGSVLGNPATLFFRLETGLDKALLSRRVKGLLPVETVTGLRRLADLDFSIPFLAGSAPASVEQDEFHDGLIRKFTGLCFTEFDEDDSRL